MTTTMENSRTDTSNFDPTRPDPTEERVESTEAQEAEPSSKQKKLGAFGIRVSDDDFAEAAKEHTFRQPFANNVISFRGVRLDGSAVEPDLGAPQIHTYLEPGYDQIDLQQSKFDPNSTPEN